ncbi:hypothetical protein DFJ73DRAFT_966845 [Zopfochytrium polystomum]|nr:hypothetical protein DFJ73DRAFT_966845 [Zopfochytrium polystomum]
MSLLLSVFNLTLSLSLLMHSVPLTHTHTGELGPRCVIILFLAQSQQAVKVQQMLAWPVALTFTPFGRQPADIEMLPPGSTGARREEDPAGVDPATCRSAVDRSTTEL